MARRVSPVALIAAATMAAASVFGSGAAPAHAQPPSLVVFFAEWSGALDDGARAVIRDAATAAARSPSVRLVITGYADNKGTQAANQDLSVLRAQVVMDALAADGVAAAQMTTAPGGPLPATGVIGRRVEIAISGSR